jgi:type VI secretion system secreted protein VgrG
MRLHTPLGGDVLLLAGLSGVEAVSEPFQYTLDLRSENPAVAPDALLGKAVTVELELPWTTTPRAIHGIVRRFRQVGVGDTLATYEAEIVPWLWLLSLRRDCRVFQHKTVPQIVEQVFKTAGYAAADYRFALHGTYPPREYCVQYRESDLDFVSRLLEDEGIHYYFEHTGRRHVLQLSDSSATAKPCPAAGAVRVDPDEMAAGFQDSVARFTRERVVHVPAVALTDYDFLKPSTRLEVELAGAGPAPESYDFPGGFTDKGEGERYAKLRLEEAEALRDVATASGAFPGFASGYQIRVAGHAMRAVDGAYLVVGVQHSAREGGFAGGDATGGFTYAARPR